MEEKLLEYQKLCNKVDEKYLELKRLREELDYLEKKEVRMALDLGKDITLGRRNRRLSATVAAEMYPSGHMEQTLKNEELRHNLYTLLGTVHHLCFLTSGQCLIFDKEGKQIGDLQAEFTTDKISLRFAATKLKNNEQN